MANRQSYDTRALVRAVYPLILAEGENPTSDRIRQRIRQEHPDLASFNPSDATINDEVRKIRRELGASMTRAASLPGVPDEVAGPAGEFVQRLLDILRGQANEELAEARQQLEADRQVAQKEIETARSQAEEAARQLEEAQRRFELEEARLAGEVALANERRAAVEGERNDLQQQLASARALLAEKTESLARVTAEKEADARRHDDQLRLAEERYLGLERAKLQELEQARQAREQALGDLDAARGELRVEREHSVALQAEIQNTTRQVAELTGELRGLREREAEKDRRIEQQDIQIRQAAGEAGQLRERIESMLQSEPKQAQQAVLGDRQRIRALLHLRLRSVPDEQREWLEELIQQVG